MRLASTNFFFIIAGRALQVVCAVAAMRLITEVLHPDEIGRRDLVLTVTSWFALLLISPVGNYVNRQAVEWDLDGRLLASLHRFSTFVVGVAVVGAIVAMLLHFTSGIGTPIGARWAGSCGWSAAACWSAL